MTGPKTNGIENKTWPLLLVSCVNDVEGCRIAPNVVDIHVGTCTEYCRDFRCLISKARQGNLYPFALTQFVLTNGSAHSGLQHYIIISMTGESISKAGIPSNELCHFAYIAICVVVYTLPCTCVLDFTKLGYGRGCDMWRCYLPCLRPTVQYLAGPKTQFKRIPRPTKHSHC